MKLLFDENLSHRLLQSAVPPWPDSRHVRDVGLAAAEDSAIWNYAIVHDFIIISKDTDFRHLSACYGHPPKVIWIKAGNCSTKRINEIILRNLVAILAFGNNAGVSFLGLE